MPDDAVPVLQSGQGSQAQRIFGAVRVGPGFIGFVKNRGGTFNGAAVNDVYRRRLVRADVRSQKYIPNEFTSPRPLV